MCQAQSHAPNVVGKVRSAPEPQDEAGVVVRTDFLFTETSQHEKASESTVAIAERMDAPESESESECGRAKNVVSGIGRARTDKRAMQVRGNAIDVSKAVTDGCTMCRCGRVFWCDCQTGSVRAL